MLIIKSVNELIEKSLDRASCYAQKAMQWKETYPSVSRALYEASLDEMDHMTRFHDEVVKIIQTYQEKHGKPPEAMQALYDYLHEKHIAEAAEVKGLQSMYKGS